MNRHEAKFIDYDHGLALLEEDERNVRYLKTRCRCGHAPHSNQCSAKAGCWCDTFTVRS
jgi:hypothetical protein